MDAADILDRTADIIEKRGHTKFKLEDWETGAVCFMGGVNMAVSGKANWCAGLSTQEYDERERAVISVFTYLGLEKNSCDCGCGSPDTEGNAVVRWNNADEREPHEVVDACRHTAKVLRG